MTRPRRAPNTCDGRARRPPSGSCGRRVLARDARQAKKEAAAWASRARRGAGHLRRSSSWCRAADGGLARGGAAACDPAAVRRRVNPRPCGARPEDLYVEYADESRAPAPRYAQMTLSQQRRRFGVGDYRAFRAVRLLAAALANWRTTCRPPGSSTAYSSILSRIMPSCCARAQKMRD